MTTRSLIYNIATHAWDGDTPALVFGTAPNFSIAIVGAVEGIEDATRWQLAVARDWLATTRPMARTTEGVTVEQTSDGATVAAKIETATDRFLRVVDGRGEGVKCVLQVAGFDTDGVPVCHITMPIVCKPALDPEGAGTVPPIEVAEVPVEVVQDMIATAIRQAQGIVRQPIVTLAGASGTVEPGEVYSIDMTEDFELSAVDIGSDYGEAVVFVKPNEYVFSVAEGMELDAEMDTIHSYRLLVSWTPVGILCEQTGQWLQD